MVTKRTRIVLRGIVGAVLGGVGCAILAVAVSVAMSAAPTARNDRIGPDGVPVVDVQYGASIEEWVVVPVALAGAALGGWLATRTTESKR